ncbi:MAG: sn-glycerol-1-phosphate dehydrogenase [Firmicutes bacterium]|nr:sn-glycerol-1-phosphate dehydrogenase [Bacillota bacterium]
MEFMHSFICRCGRTHVCPVREVLIGHDVIRNVPRLLARFKRVLIVSDIHTRPLVFQELSEALFSAGIVFDEVFFDQPDVLIPDEAAIDRIRECLAAGTEGSSYDVLIGIGSGVINDLCKYTSYQADLPYMIIATAPSMDGFASVGAALILKGMKVTLNAHVASWIIGDTRILKDAPMDMIRAGIGDILGKYSCLNDWKLAHVITGEHFCQTIYDMTMKEVLKTRNNIKGCINREETAVGDLMESLVMVGMAMAYMGNSRPASGSEHHFSHFFEITGVAFHEPYLAHGIDVAYSSILTACLRQMLLETDPASFCYSFDERGWEEEVRKVYRVLAPEVIALQKKAGLYQRNDLSVILAYWQKIQRILSDAPSADETIQLLAQAGYDLKEFASFYGEDRIRTAIRWAKDLKDRYTVLWLLENIGLLKAFAEQLNLSIYKPASSGVE